MFEEFYLNFNIAVTSLYLQILHKILTHLLMVIFIQKFNCSLYKERMSEFNETCNKLKEFKKIC